MLDIKFIRENAELIKKTIQGKKIDLDLEALLAADEKRVALLQEMEVLSAEKNKLNEEMKTATDKSGVIVRGKEVKEKMAKLEPEYRKIKYVFESLMVKVPAPYSPDTPIGSSDEDNVEVYNSNNIPAFDFEPKDHIQLGRDLDILDLEKGAKVAGYRGYYVKNEGVSLMMGFMMYAINKLMVRGYSPMIVPTLVKEFSLFGSGYFKGLEYNPEVDEIYQVATSEKEATGEMSKDKKFLVGTAEPSLLAYYADEVLRAEQLPLRMCGYSQCYRSEIGSYGKDTRGFYRVHEFMKVEQVVLLEADIKQAEAMQDEMVAISREMHEELGLPYRQLAICTGDLGAGKYRQYDLEAWMPGMKRYGETGSASIFTDWQARRLNVKYADKEGNKKYVYMLNNTALPSPRIFIAILENHQQADGSVKIPEVLKKFMPLAMDEIRARSKSQS